MNDTPIPLRTYDLVEWLRQRFPEHSPRSPEEVQASLRRGAQRELIDVIAFELARTDEEA